ncbi:hypothetical protein [Kribbella sp. NPDC000426]|uniref:hypothetical protein n=1 Tax=Kribbella sp. NPDC000426 TaxID=3154255 RepID=UPI00331C43F5
MGKRNYSEATRSALFALSTKCYFPECNQPTITFFDDEPEKKVQIAHIHAVSPNGPRWITDVDVDAFANLILLCTLHHRKVDNKANEEIYPAGLLRKWKAAAEREVRSKVDGLDRLTEQRLEEMLEQSTRLVRTELESALQVVHGINEGAADLLRAVLQRLNDHYLDNDAIASLAESSYRLMNLEDNVAVLWEASRRLDGLEGNAQLLSGAGETLDGLEWRIEALTRAAGAAEASADRAAELVDSIDNAGDRVLLQLQVAASSIDLGVISRDANRWKYFAAGVIVATVLAITGAVVQAHGI